MTVRDEHIVDQWSFLDYKKNFANKFIPMGGVSVPNWAQEHGRRLTAYTIYEDYYKAASRRWLNTEDEEERAKRREYADPYMMVESVLSSVLGEEQLIEVEGHLDEIAALAQPPGAPAEGEAPPSPPEDQVVGPSTVVFDLLSDWATKERFLIKLNEAERKAIKLGDAVYVLGWDEENERPRLRVWDPGFYFPVLDDWENESDWPKRIHMAWEYDKKIGGKDVTFLRRITWEMRPITGATTLPWNTKPHTETCWMREQEWKLNDEIRGDIEDLSESNSIDIKEDTDLGIDFIPVVHLPNTPAEDEHYGLSNLGPVLQIIDELQACDTDLASASATTGSPPLSVKGILARNDEGKVTSAGPGSVYESENGAEFLDTSKSLDALLKYKEGLQDRYSVNGRIPNTLIGRIDPSKVPSGIVLTLSFQPHSNMIRQMRLVRQDKYNLLLKFVVRYYMKNDPNLQFNQPHLQFGSYLPSDRQETATIIWNLVHANAMSIETAVQMMIQAGFPIEDAQQEVLRIMSQDFEGAKALAEASGDINASRAMLRLKPISLDELGNPLGGDEETGGTSFTLPEGSGLPPAFG